jgi:hypothetical protein
LRQVLYVEQAYTFHYCAPASNNIEIAIGEGGPKPSTHTSIETESGKHKTLEAMIVSLAHEAAHKVYVPKTRIVQWFSAGPNPLSV